MAGRTLTPRPSQPVDYPSRLRFPSDGSSRGEPPVVRISVAPQPQKALYAKRSCGNAPKRFPWFRREESSASCARLRCTTCSPARAASINGTSRPHRVCSCAPSAVPRSRSLPRSTASGSAWSSPPAASRASAAASAKASDAAPVGGVRELLLTEHGACARCKTRRAETFLPPSLFEGSCSRDSALAPRIIESRICVCGADAPPSFYEEDSCWPVSDRGRD